MKHFVTISLVFFSLTHLAKTQQMEGLRLLTERYCNRQQTAIHQVVQGDDQNPDDLFPFFLTPDEITMTGIRPAMHALSYQPAREEVASVAVREQPRNNSP